MYRGTRNTSATARSWSRTLQECLACLRCNEMMFDLEVDSGLIEQRIYERQALLCRYRYLLARARELGLHTVLARYRPRLPG